MEQLKGNAIAAADHNKCMIRLTIFLLKAFWGACLAVLSNTTAPSLYKKVETGFWVAVFVR